MKERIEKLKSKAHKSNVSKLWLVLPVVGWAYYPIQKKKHKGYNKKLEVDEAAFLTNEEVKKNINHMLLTVEENLIPALDNYLESIAILQAVFQQFNMQCKGIKDKLEQTGNKLQ